MSMRFLLHNPHFACPSLRPLCSLPLVPCPKDRIEVTTATKYNAVLVLAERLRHRVGHIDVTPERIYQEAKITYVVKGDRTEEEMVVKGFAVFYKGVDEERVRRFDVYGDFSEVYGRMAEVQKGGGGERKEG